MAQTCTVNSRGKLSQTRFRKAENDVVSINVDFGLFFDTDTASTLTVTADPGITVDSSSVSSNVANMVLSGGSDGSIYDITLKLAGTTETKEVVIQVHVLDYDYPHVNDYWQRGYWS